MVISGLSAQRNPHLSEPLHSGTASHLCGQTPRQPNAQFISFHRKRIISQNVRYDASKRQNVARVQLLQLPSVLSEEQSSDRRPVVCVLNVLRNHKRRGVLAGKFSSLTRSFAVNSILNPTTCFLPHFGVLSNGKFPHTKKLTPFPLSRPSAPMARRHRDQQRHGLLWVMEKLPITTRWSGLDLSR